MCTAKPPRVIADQLALSRVNTRAHTHAHAAELVANALGTPHRPGGSIEYGERSVPERLHHATAESPDLLLNDSIMTLQQIAPAPIAQLRSPLGGADNVREQNAGQRPFDACRGSQAGHEGLDLVDDRVEVAEPEGMIATW
jgi:hypothetical protein